MLTLATRQNFHSVRFDGNVYDTGSKLGFLSANVAYAMDRDDIAPAFRQQIAAILAG